MKLLFICAALLPAIARADVIECPASFPAGNLQLPEGTVGQSGAVRILPSRLSGAFMVSGEKYAEQEFVPETRRVSGGRDVFYNFPSPGRWLVCGYGGNVERWFALNPKIVECELRIRQEARAKSGGQKFTATAVCR